MSSIKERENNLKSRLAELKQLDAGANSEQAIVVLDQQSVGRLSRIDALQRQQMAKETHRRRQLERAKILAALVRLEEGEYGWCADCGCEISERRLDVDPTAHLCIKCTKYGHPSLGSPLVSLSDEASIHFVCRSYFRVSDLQS